ncbi:DUF6695 family protein [Gilvibacter sp.]|uniref:DUF6695 family protein n=1 Tax=Gilvibacter sp. TaxID=2729997 RepID=UPI0025BC3053|nr:DUF6695 family protein [Gilvibacter sp.]NQX78511.1 hypothetical protein [Gilvibacter sp.]
MTAFKQDGKLVAMAFPDTFVRMSSERLCRFLPLVGLGTRSHIKAGHAALVLIENATGKARYYDFGRYVTPEGHGRVRGANTDAELEIPFKGRFDANFNLKNTEEFLLWLEAHPEKTHGEGRLLASVCDKIDFNRAKAYIDSLQGRGSIPYGAFVKEGSNCSRFVTETLLASTQDPKIIKRLNRNKKFTPSTVGNVEQAATESAVYQVHQGKIETFNGTAFKENLKNYFDKKHGHTSNCAALEAPHDKAQLLTGIGSSAWFDLQEGPTRSQFVINRYNEKKTQDFSGIFTADAPLDLQLPYSFIYDSNCEKCTVVQQQQQITLRVHERISF